MKRPITTCLLAKSITLIYPKDLDLDLILEGFGFGNFSNQLQVTQEILRD